MNIDIGIAKPTNSAFLNPKKNIKTVITKITPKMMLLAKSLTMFFVVLDWSFEISTWMVLGKSFAITSSTMTLILSTDRIRFFPLRFLTSRTKAVFPSNRA